MTSSVFDLLSDLLAPAEMVRVKATPAKAANSANLKHSCGLLADSDSANPLRILANLTEADHEWFEERAGILEFDAGMSRAAAEIEARELLRRLKDKRA